MIGMLDVFDASTASGSVMTSSSSAKISRLDGLVLDDRLDHQLAVGQVGQVGGERQLGQRRVALALGELARADAALQRLGDAVAARGDQRLGRLVDHDVDAGARGHLGDAGAHLSGADDAHPFESARHRSSPMSPIASGPAQDCWAGPALSTLPTAQLNVARSGYCREFAQLARSRAATQWNWPSSVEPASAVVDEVGSTVVAIRSK